MTWSWNDPGNFHDVIGQNFALSGEPRQADTVSFTFASPGTYTYVCEVHVASGMRGQVTVQ